MYMKPNFNMGGGIRSLLSPLTNMITQHLAKQSQESFNDKIDPYIDQVETLTTETFPELDMSSTGGGIGNFPSPSINAPLFQPSNPTGIQPYRAFGVPADSPLHKNDLSTFVDFGNQMNQKGKNPSYQATPLNNILDQGMQALYGYK
tara:strand:- start:3098 stop:3538 length:441 start_codon:yes stop_codon:yes gene_type:complete